MHPSSRSRPRYPLAPRALQGRRNRGEVRAESRCHDLLYPHERRRGQDFLAVGLGAAGRPLVPGVRGNDPVGQDALEPTIGGKPVKPVLPRWRNRYFRVPLHPGDRVAAGVGDCVPEGFDVGQ